MESLVFRLRSFDFTIQVIVAVLFGVFLGVISFVLPPMITLFLIIGVPVCLIAIQKPEIAILAILTMLCTIIPDTSIPRINIGVGKWYLTDIILIVLIAMIIIRWLIDRQFRLAQNPMGISVLTFWMWAMFTTIIALIQRNVDSVYAIPEMRSVAYYLMFFVVANLVFQERGLHFLVNGLFFLATIVSAMMIAQFIVGDAVPILPGRVETLATEDVMYAGITRIMDTVGEGLITVAFITKTAVVFIRRFQFRRFADIFQWAIMGIAVILTFSRTHWLVTGLAMLMTFFLIRQQDRISLIKWVLILFFFLPIIIVPILVSPESIVSKLVIAAVERAVSLNPENVITPSSTNTFRWRDFEYIYGLPQVAAHPFMGLGLGAKYRPEVYSIDDEAKNTQHYTHNSHLWVAMKTGLIGYALLLLMSFTFIWRGFSYWSRIYDPYMSGIALGFALAYLSAFIAGLIHPIFVTLFWTPILGTMMGINEVIYRIYKPGEFVPPPPAEIPSVID